MADVSTLRISDQARATTATRLLIAAFFANLGLVCLSYVVNWLLPNSWEGPWPLVEELLWLGFSGVLVVALMMLASALLEGKTLPVVAAVVWIFSSLFDLGSTLLVQVQRGNTSLGLPASVQTLFFDLEMLVTLGARALLFIFFIRLTMQTRAWVLPLLALAWLFSAVRFITSIAVAHTEHGYELYSNPVWRYGTVAASFFGAIAVLVAAVAVHQVVSGVTATPATAQAGLVPPPVVEAPNPTADFLVGGILLVVGIGVTVVSMQAASNGGRYVVATGAIGVGLGRIIRGFVRLAKR